MTQDVSPLLKWAGGKRQLLSTLVPLFPKKITNYCEPFLGGGSVLFCLKPKNALVNDINEELINFYNVVKTDVKELLDLVKSYPATEEFYYELRNIDKDKDAFLKFTNVQRAARTFYLNRYCFNGLYRVNSKGYFNSPYGHRNKPYKIVDEKFLNLSDYFNNNNIIITSKKFDYLLDDITDDMFVYLDPPYDLLQQTSFVSYSKDNFNTDDQLKLLEFCNKLNERGIKFMESNAATPFILDNYKNYKIKIVKANRLIASKNASRKPVDEVIITNY